MTSDLLRLVQVSTSARGGGAERVAETLHRGFVRRGHRSWMVVAHDDGDDPSVLEIPDPASKDPVRRKLQSLAVQMDPLVARFPPLHLIQRSLRLAASPRRYFDSYLGREHFGYPGTAVIPDLVPELPDLLHLHNLHGGYFDLRQLSPLSHRLPLLMTLHDEWTYTGHCAYTMGSDRWRTGCRSCPDLTIYPAIRRDATRANLRAKQAIYARSRLYVCAPSRWLLDRAKESILRKGAAAWRVIPNGVDRSVFRAGDKIHARRELRLPTDPFIVLFVANMARTNPFKDFETVNRAVKTAAASTSRPLHLIVLGEAGSPELGEQFRIDFVPFEAELGRVALYYRAADVYLHAAHADNFPTTILEAMATGIPVVATAVGGIEEQVRSLSGAPGAWDGTSHDIGAATGVLVAPGDGDAMGAACATILGDEELRATLGANASKDATHRFDLEDQLDATIDWYRDALADWRSRRRGDRRWNSWDR